MVGIKVTHLSLTLSELTTIQHGLVQLRTAAETTLALVQNQVSAQLAEAAADLRRAARSQKKPKARKALGPGVAGAQAGSAAGDRVQ